MSLTRRLFVVLVVSCFLVAVSVPAVAQVGKMTPEKKIAMDTVDQLKPTFDKIARYIWERPELSLVEFKATAALQKYLKDNGFTIKTGIGGIETAFIATWGSGKPVVGFIGEFDALPNISQESGVTELKPVVKDAPGQGCGHNLYGTASATAAIATAKAMQKQGIKGTVQFFGCSAEETLIGKVFMSRAGAWKDTDFCVAWHPADVNAVGNTTNLALKNFKVQFYGQSSHAGTAPERGRSALDGVELFDIAMNFMREHLPDNIRIHYVITSGGEAPNNVPPFAEVWYYVRARQMPIVEDMYQRAIKAAEGAALMTGTKAVVKLIAAAFNTLPNTVLGQVGEANELLLGAPPFTAEDQAFGAKVAKTLEKMGAKGINPPYYDTTITKTDYTKRYPDIPFGTASSDIGNVTWQVPTVSFSVATQVKKTIGHNWTMVCQTGEPASMKAGLQVAKYMAATALDVIKNPKILADAQKEFQGYIAVTPYVDPIPKDLPVPTYFELYGREWESVPKTPQYLKKD